MKTWAERIIEFNQELHFDKKLPDGIAILNPFRDHPEAFSVSSQFYRKYYNDDSPRSLILGINPGRLGAGHTGVPFTDTIRLTTECGIGWNAKPTYEPSSVFVYDVIRDFGGPEKFYRHFYISSICPLGFTKQTSKGVVNYNYYDSNELSEIMIPWMVKQLKKQMDFGINKKEVFCFGAGKNKLVIENLNREFHFFEKLTALEHPRYIMQYKSASKQHYVTKYLSAFDQVIGTGR